MTRNEIIDFLLDQTIDKDKVLYGMLKDEKPVLDKIEKHLIDSENKKPQFVSRDKCRKCRFWHEETKSCMSVVAHKKGCGHPSYKYFESNENE